MPDLSVYGKLQRFDDYQRANEEFMLKKQLAEAQLMSAFKGGDSPSAVREYEYFNSLDDAGKKQFIQVKRANPYMNTGDNFTQVDPLSGQVTNQVPINPKMSDMPDFQAQQEKAKKDAERLSKAQGDLSGVETKASQISGILKQLKEHPGKASVVGAKNPFTGAVTSAIPFYPRDEVTGIKKPIPGSEAAGFNELLKQSKGQQFLQAFEMLKGGGHITEIEGTKATQAISRMSAAQSEKEFDAAVDELESIITAGVAKARKSAGGQAGGGQTGGGGNKVNWSDL